MKVKLEIDKQLAENTQTAIRALMAVDGDMHKRLREAIFQELKRARDSIVARIKFENGDPRGTAHAVKRYIAGKYLGGVVSIMDGKRSGTTSNYEPPRKLRTGQRGGNRMSRGKRTKEIMAYGPQDRGFILRFVNSGTRVRYALHGRNGRNQREYLAHMDKHGGAGNRGAIAPRDFFTKLGDPAMQKAVENLSQIVQQEFDKVVFGQ